MTLTASAGASGPPIVGVLGGMGPAATADLLAKIFVRTPVDREQDHLIVAVWSNPKTPDRTLALQGLGPSPVPAMLDGVRRLEAMGAQMIAIPCNTAHAFLGELENADTNVRFFNMIGATVNSVTLTQPEARRVGILSTTGTRLAGLYFTECDRRGLTAIELEERDQVRLVDPAISAVKAGQPLDTPRRRVREAVEVLAERGAQLVIAGCTEIPLISSEAACVLPVIDATECLASAIVAYAYALSVPCGTSGGVGEFDSRR